MAMPESNDGMRWDRLGFVSICICAFATPVDCQRVETVTMEHHPSL